MNDKKVVNVVFDRDAVACRSFMGFGVEWDPGYARVRDQAAAFSDADWGIVVGRMSWMRIPAVRMMMQTKFCYMGDGKYDWDTPEMKYLYRHLDVCMKMGIGVVLTDWGCERDWLKIPGIERVSDPKYAEAIGTYMDQLVNVRGYTCIKHFVMVNEPNLEVSDWSRWKVGVEQVAGAFARRGLDRKVGIAGSDESENETWHRMAVDQLQRTLSAYDLHRYAKHNNDPALDEVRSGRLYELLRGEWDYALARDPGSVNKPLFVGEAGIMHPGFSASNNPCDMEFLYGLKMADYAAQATAAGSWLVSAWMLDDSSHKGFTWGMWKNKENGFVLKPWFYPWALLTRFVPGGSTTYRSGRAAGSATDAVALRYASLSGVSPAEGLRAMAARSNSASAPGWTVWLVNRASEPRTVDVRAFDAGPAVFRHYVYKQDSAPADRDGMPVPVITAKGDLGAGVQVVCPPNGMYMLTSIL